MADFMGNIFPTAGLWSGDVGAGNYYQGSPSQIRSQEQRSAELNAQREAVNIRERELAEREFQAQMDKNQREKERIAIQKGQAAAEKWYREQEVKLAKKRFQEEQRQFDLTFGEGQRQFDLTHALNRDQFQNDALFGWTKEAIQLASRPADWVKLRRMQSGVAEGAGSMPGLDWARGGQLGNTTFVGDPQSNSLSNVMGPMGINVGQPAAAPAPTGVTAQSSIAAPTSGNWASQAAQQADQMARAPLNLSGDEQQLYQTARDFAMNSHQAAPGWYESLDPLTRDLMQGAAEAQGLDWASALSRYRRSRWGGGGSAQAA